MQIRRATASDLYDMQHSNLICLPENYSLRYYYFHLLSWPKLLYVQKDYNEKTVGYVLAMMDNEEKEEKCHGHITSIAVLRTHRKLGIASRAMKATMKEMRDTYRANYCSLHVRKTNDAALHLYQDSLHFRCAGVEEAYYMDSEDAYLMKAFFTERNSGKYVDADKNLIRKPVPPDEEKQLMGDRAISSSLQADTKGAESVSSSIKDKKVVEPTQMKSDTSAASAVGSKKSNAGDYAVIPLDSVVAAIEGNDSGKGSKKKNQEKRDQQPHKAGRKK